MRRYSVEDDSFFDSISQKRHEHASILRNVMVASWNGEHETFGSTMRLKTEFIGEERTTLLNPCAIVEVLSNATRAYDPGEKFESYRSIDSLQEYLLIEQVRPSVELCRRVGNQWTGFTFESLDQSVHLASIHVDLPLARIDKRVMFPR